MNFFKHKAIKCQIKHTKYLLRKKFAIECTIYAPFFDISAGKSSFKLLEKVYLEYQQLRCNGCHVLEKPTPLVKFSSEKAQRHQLPRVVFEKSSSKGKRLLLFIDHQCL
jgi:hypothetical protein